MLANLTKKTINPNYWQKIFTLTHKFTMVNTSTDRLSEKHPDFDIQPVNTIRPPDIKYKRGSQPLVPIDTPLSVIRKHIPRQSDIDKIVKT